MFINVTTTIKTLISDIFSYYSEVCDTSKQCFELKSYLSQQFPQIQIKCEKSKVRGSFEVKINDHLVHSKLQSIAFPVYEDVALNVKNCMEGKEMNKVREQKITDCCIS